MTRSDPHPLDNPAWSALTGRQASLGEGGAFARRFHPEVSPFAAIAAPTPDCLDALAGLLRADETALLIADGPLPEVSGVKNTPLFEVVQMVETSPAEIAPDRDIQSLTAADVPEMMALAERTKPGPFGPRTGEMGRYLGIRDEARLIAMAGERLQFAGHREISAVCVDEAFRGRRLAQHLMTALRREIRAKGELPFLHVRSDAPRTQRLYEHMGFAPRRSFTVHQIGLV
ncbi:GNAT family N-acetyltransferase [Paracoccus aminophilus]|uniref:GCN5-related N-acetyltransferase n=1 Tax=Paracoccus aminophilus JCM 7686 TaxID=1367847 RepID=S5YU53_PARAH|nr:GNAT family N-acetyltransferase [Paracoccus aminophilus]AGT08771.1 GCN5-related N-acetyltransferase [Paracoccus aminophilus JCM 7686]